MSERDTTAGDDKVPSQGAEITQTISENEEENIEGLRRVPGRLPWALFLVVLVEFGERFVYLGITAPMQNYISNPYDPNGRLPGALGRGQSVATALSDFFKFWSYACTVGGAVISDEWLGKPKTILASAPIYIIGLVILTATSTPAAIKANASFGGLIASMITVGLGTGGIKACVAPLCGEQDTTTRPYVKQLKSGERVLVDPKLTSASIFMWYYWAANVGSLSALATVEIEKERGFWAAFLVPLVVFMAMLLIFIIRIKSIVNVPPQGSAVVDACKTLAIAFKERSLEKAKPSVLRANGHFEKHEFASNPRYSDGYVDQVKSGLLACKYFILFPFYFICWTQMFNNLISQAGSMDLRGTPNDLLQNLETIAMLIFIPFLDIIVYPALRQWNINFNPIARIFAGFMLGSAGMLYACVLQHYIYKSPSESIYVWVQAPAYILLAFSEIFVVITGLEVAFLKAPVGLRTFVSSLFWITIAIGAAIAIGLAPVSTDPYMVWTYGALTIVPFVAGCIFYVCFKDSIKNVPVLEGVGVSGVEQPALEQHAAGGDPLTGKIV